MLGAALQSLHKVFEHEMLISQSICAEIPVKSAQRTESWIFWPEGSFHHTDTQSKRSRRDRSDPLRVLWDVEVVWKGISAQRRLENAHLAPLSLIPVSGCPLVSLESLSFKWVQSDFCFNIYFSVATDLFTCCVFRCVCVSVCVQQRYECLCP